MYNKLVKNTIYGKTNTPRTNYIIDYSEVLQEYTITNYGHIIDHGTDQHLFSMMQRIQQNDIARGKYATFQIRNNSIYNNIKGYINDSI